MSVTRTKVETGAEVHPADTEAADLPTQAEIAVVLVTTVAVPLTETAAEVVTTVVVTEVQAAANAAAMETPAAVTEEVSAAEAADRQPREGTLVTASTEEINSLFFNLIVCINYLRARIHSLFLSPHIYRVLKETPEETCRSHV